MKNPRSGSRPASTRTSGKAAKRLEWSPAADDDKFQAWLFIAADNEIAADRVVARIAQQAELLIRFPLLGKVGRIPRTRELVVSGTPFVLIYRLTTQAIRIGRVLHHSRRYP